MVPPVSDGLAHLDRQEQIDRLVTIRVRLQKEVELLTRERDNARAHLDHADAKIVALQAELASLRAVAEAAKRDVLFSIESELETWQESPHPHAATVRERLQVVLDAQRAAVGALAGALPHEEKT